MRSSRRAAGPSPRRQPSEALSVLTLHLSLASSRDLALGEEHEVRPLGPLPLVAPERLAKEPLRAVSLHGTAQPATGGQAQTVVVASIGQSHQGKQRAVEPEPATKHAPVVRSAGDPLVRPESRE